MPAVTIREMLEAGVHFGHQTKRWNPKMKPYIFGARNGIYILDLQQTVGLFDNAYRFAMQTTARGEKVLFVGTKKQAQEVIAEEAKRAGQFFVTNRWLGGTLTNFRTIKGSIDRLKSIEKMSTDGTFQKLTKKEVLLLTKERTKLEKNLGGIKDMERLPGALFVVDPNREAIGVAEANRCKIPVIAITDTNCDPENVDYVIPGNDDAMRSVRLFARKLADGCIAGDHLYQQQLRERKADERQRARAQQQQTTPVKPKPSPGGEGHGPQVEVIHRLEDEESAAVPHHTAG